MERVIFEGTLEKYGGTQGLFSRWAKRYFILTRNKLQYFTNSTRADKRGEFILDERSFVSHKSCMDKRDFVFCLHAQGQSRQELILSAVDFSELSAWENMINTTVDKLKRKARELENELREATAGENGKIARIVSRAIDKKQDGTYDNVAVLKRGKLEKCGRRVKTWTTRWFILTETCITYFSDDTYLTKKGARHLDRYSFVKRMGSEGGRAHLFSLFTGLGEVELLMNAPSAEALTSWERTITSAIENVVSTTTHMAVDVSFCKAISKQVAEPVYRICVQTYRACLEEYFHFADLRELRNHIHAVAPKLSIKSKFPESYKRSAFGGGVAQLSPELQEKRRSCLETWLQEIFDLFPRLGAVKFASFNGVEREPDSDDDSFDGSDDAGTGSASQASTVQLIIAKLFGTTANFLINEFIIDEALSAVNFEDAAEMATDVELICRSRNIAIFERPTPVVVRKTTDGVSTRLITLFNELHVSSSALPFPSDRVEDEEENNELAENEVPSCAEELLQFNVIKLGEFCRTSNIDFTEFKNKKQYIRALLLKLSNVNESFLHKKDARAEVRKLMASASRGDSSVAVTVDLIWSDLLRRLGISANLHSALMYSYQLNEKLAVIAQTVTIWNSHVQFSKEDYNLIRHMSTGRNVNSFLLLAIKFRIENSTSKNQWIKAFCSFRGITALLTVLLTRLERLSGLGNAVDRADAADILQVLYCIRNLVSSECLGQVMETPGVILAVGRCVLLLKDYDAIACQALEIFAELIMYSGEASTVWQLQHVFEELAQTSNVYSNATYSVLIAALESGNSFLQSAVMILLNCMLIYESDFENRIKIRNELNILDFEFKCSVAIRKRNSDKCLTMNTNKPIISSQAFASEDGKTMIDPTNGVMAGFLTRVDGDDDVAGAGSVKSKASAASKTEVWESAENLWCILTSEGLCSPSTDGSENYCFKFTDITDTLDYSYYPSQPSRFNFMVLGKHGRHLCFEVTSEKLRHQWCVAIRTAHAAAMVHRRAYDLSEWNQCATDNRSLDQNFEIHFEIYQTLARGDEMAMYDGGLLHMTTPLALASALQLEFRRNKSSNVLKSSLDDLAVFAMQNFMPRRHVKEDKPHKNIHPAVVSMRPIAQAPPLPFVPPDKPVRKTPVKLKQLYWTKIKSVNVAKTIWEEVEEPDIDLELLMNCFGQKSSKAVEKKATNAKTKLSHKSTVKDIRLFDNGRMQNVAIASAKLKKTPDEIADMIVRLDPHDLTPDTTDIVKNLLVPTAEEMKIIMNYKGGIGNLDFTGRMFFLFMDIERLDQRLECQRIMLNWQDGADMVSAQLVSMMAVLAELNSVECIEGLKALFATTLAVGNYMNADGSRGQAHGFDLDVLLKLKTVRATEGRGTILHYIAEQMSASYPELPCFYSNWNVTWKSGKLSMKNLEQVLKELQSGLFFCEFELEAAEKLKNVANREALVRRLEIFLAEAMCRYEEMCRMHERVLKLLHKTRLFIGDSPPSDPNEDSLQRLFIMMQKVAEAHSQAVHDIVDWKRKDTNAKQPTYTKRVSRITTEEGSELVASQYSLHTIGGRERLAGRASAGAQGEVLRQMKEQMIKFRQNKECDDVTTLLEDEDSDDLL